MYRGMDRYGCMGIWNTVRHVLPFQALFLIPIPIPSRLNTNTKLVLLRFCGLLLHIVVWMAQYFGIVLKPAFPLKRKLCRAEIGLWHLWTSILRNLLKNMDYIHVKLHASMYQVNYQASSIRNLCFADVEP